MKLHAALSSQLVARIFTVPRLVEITVQGDTDLALLRNPESSIVKRNSTRVAQDQGLPNDPGFCRRIAFRGLRVDAASSRSITTRCIALARVNRSQNQHVRKENSQK